MNPKRLKVTDSATKVGCVGLRAVLRSGGDFKG